MKIHKALSVFVWAAVWAAILPVPSPWSADYVYPTGPAGYVPPARRPFWSALGNTSNTSPANPSASATGSTEGRSGDQTQMPMTRELAAAPPGAGLEGAISEDTYHLGPGDSLLISVWGPQAATFRVGVNLEGRVVVPGIGETSVNGVSLKEARRRIIPEVMQNFRNVQVTVDLIGLRRFRVHVLGEVQKAGSYLATAVDRVSSAVAWAGGFSPNASQRRIEVMSGDSLRARADLLLFLRRGDTSQNPWLHDGDVVYVPYAHDQITIDGAVNFPTGLEYVPGDRLSDALAYAGWLTNDALAESIECVRYRPGDPDPMRFFAVAGGGLSPADTARSDVLPEVVGSFSLPDTVEDPAGPYPDFLLRPDDQVFVRSMPESRQTPLVEISGEVARPGKYPIVEAHTRLSQLVAQAGGPTPEAFLTEARLIRRGSIRTEDREFDRLKEIPPGQMTKDEYEYFKLRSREEPGLMVIDFQKLLGEGDTQQDVILQNGDLVMIPSRRDFVSVLGQVRNPGIVLYQEGLEPKDYLQKAGGMAERADRGKARVIRASTGERVSLGRTDKVEAGDTIWIPEQPPRSLWTSFKDVLGVTAQVVTIFLVIDTIRRR